MKQPPCPLTIDERYKPRLVDVIPADLFAQVDVGDKAATDAAIKTFFDAHKMVRGDVPHVVPGVNEKTAYNSWLHRATNDLLKQVKQERNAAARVEKAACKPKEVGALKQEIKARGKAKADATLLTDAVLDQLRQLGVDLSPLEALTAAAVAPREGS